MNFTTGDRVKVKNNLAWVRSRCADIVSWNPRMHEIIGKTVTIADTGLDIVNMNAIQITYNNTYWAIPIDCIIPIKPNNTNQVSKCLECCGDLTICVTCPYR